MRNQKFGLNLKLTVHERFNSRGENTSIQTQNELSFLCRHVHLFIHTPCNKGREWHCISNVVKSVNQPYCMNTHFHMFIPQDHFLFT